MTNLVSPQESAWQRGNKLSRSLGSFYTLNFVLSVLLLLTDVSVLWLAMNLAESNHTAATLVIYGAGAILILLQIAGAAIFLRATRSAKEAIGSVTDYVQQRRGLNANKVDHFIKWLTIWQWLAVVGAVLGGIGGGSIARMLNGLVDTAKDNNSVGLVLNMTTGMSSIIRSIIQAVLTWLILATIKEFFKAIMRHSTGEPLLISPFAQRAGNWMTFTLVILILVALISGLAYLGGSAAIILANGHNGFHIPVQLNLLALLPVILLAAAQIWQIVLVAWSGGFARDVGSALDDNQAGGPQAADPWAGAVIEQR